MKKKLLYTTIIALLSSPAFADKAKIINPNAQNKIPDNYIVVLNDLYLAEYNAKDMTRQYSGKLKHVYKKVLNGFTIKLNPNQLERLRDDPRVDYIELDQKVSLTGTQTPATWGLDRVDQRNLPLNNTYNYQNTGAGVHAYIIDTGLLTTHSDFGGRASSGWDFVDNDSHANDCNGHGTHVAGTVGGSTYGVAKAVNLHGVKVLNCAGSGTNSDVIAGIDWVANNHISPAVANLSLGGGASSSIDSAVNNLFNSGVTVVVAAGNDNISACSQSPARVPNAITVGSTTSSDARSSFSNFGTCLDIFAPGSSITSTWNNGGTNTISGTSMASPHVAGAVALHLEGNSNDTPTQVTNAIMSNATTGKVTSAGTGSVNRLLYTGTSSNAAPPTMTYLYSEYIGCQNYNPRYIIDWAANSSSAILEYDMDANYNNSSTWYNSYNGTSQAKILVGNSSTTTKVRVRARNADGWSGYSTETLRTINCFTGGGPLY